MKNRSAKIDVAFEVLESYPEEDVFGGVEPRSVDPSRERRVPLADDAAGEAGDCALNCRSVSEALPARYSVCDHEVDGILCGTADL